MSTAFPNPIVVKKKKTYVKASFRRYVKKKNFFKYTLVLDFY